MHLRYFKISKVALDRLPCFDLISPQQACLLASLELPRSTVTLSPCTSTRAAWSLPHQPSAPSFSLCREPSSPDSSATLSTASTATSGAVLAQGFSCRVGSAKLTLTALLCIFPRRNLLPRKSKFQGSLSPLSFRPGSRRWPWPVG